jgi:ABC-type Fe3+ transport system permease subunit
VFAFLAALVSFCVVQDRVTASGAQRYAALQRLAIAGAGPAVTIDEVMRPAVRRSLRDGLLAAGGAAGVGLAGAAAVRRSRRG